MWKALCDYRLPLGQSICMAELVSLETVVPDMEIKIPNLVALGFTVALVQPPQEQVQ
jgi:hypothetical protein